MIINMTPHPVNIVTVTGEEILTIPPSGKTIRLETVTTRVMKIDGVEITRTVFGKPEVIVTKPENIDARVPREMPEQADNVYYIVSQIIKSALPGRADLLVPAEIVRNETGQIVGCRSLGI